jgi:16S rRNA (guanine527-N7)-methyltransferase
MLCPPDAFRRACDALGLEIPAGEMARLVRYLHLLLETNKQFNLTAIRDPDEAWMRHILDSLSLLPHLGAAQALIDIGSGGGLPGIPIAIVQPHLRVTLLEATGKKANFLRTVAAELPLQNIVVVSERAETAGHDRAHRDRYDLVTARAVGPLNVMLEYTLPFAAIGGRVLAMKGRKAEQELRDAGDAILLLGGGQVNVYEALPDVEPDAVIVEITKERPTPRKYPRSAGTPKQDPL